MSSSPATASSSPRALPPLNTRPTTRLHVFVAGGSEPQDLGLGGRAVEHPNGGGGTQRPVLNTLLDVDSVGVVQISVGLKHAAALTHDGKVLTWGCNDFFALGREAELMEDEARPGVVAGLEALDVVQVAATDHATFILTTTGLVYGWGSFMGDDGILGFTKELIEHKTKARPEELAASAPTRIPALRDITHLAAGSNHVLALTRTGNVYAWGTGNQGELGRRLVYRHRYESLTPRTVSLPKNQIVRIFAGFSHNFAIDKRGRVFAWGLNNFGQTGILAEDEEERGENIHVTHPARVECLEKMRVRAVAPGLHHSVACMEDGRVMVWGRCDTNQVGASLEFVPEDVLLCDERGVPRVVTVPVQIPSFKASTVAAGTDNCFAISDGGDLFAWGFSDDYRTGLGTEDPVGEPTEVLTGSLAGLRCVDVVSGGQLTVFTGVAG